MRYTLIIALNLMLSLGCYASNYTPLENWGNEVAALKGRKGEIFNSGLMGAHRFIQKTAKFNNDVLGIIEGKDLIEIVAPNFINKGQIISLGEIHLYTENLENIGIIKAPKVCMYSETVDRMNGAIIADEFLINFKRKRPNASFTQLPQNETN